MKKILLISLLLGATNLFAQQQIDSVQTEQIKENLIKLEKQEALVQELVFNLKKQDSSLIKIESKLNNIKLDKDQKIEDLYSNLNNQNRIINRLNNSLEIASIEIDKKQFLIDSLSQLIQTNSQNIDTNSKELGAKIQETGQEADKQIAQLDNSVENNRLYWIIATLVTLLLGGLIYWLLSKRIKSSKTDVETQIRNTKTSLEEESLKLDSKLMEVLDTQLKLRDLSHSEKSDSEEKDHSLVLKVADEVTRILMNLQVMDKNIKGYKHLKKYSESILDNLKAYGYEIPQLIGQNYKTGMNIVATMEFDENIEEGKEIIKRIIKPQVNYNGKMIQAAKVIVAYKD